MTSRQLVSTKVLLYPTLARKGYIITFDGCGPGEDEVVKSLKQGVGERRNQIAMTACVTDYLRLVC